MAEVVTPGQFVFRLHGNTRYDWNSWLDGQRWKLRKGTRAQVERGERDFFVEVEAFRSAAFGYAWRHGMKITTSVLPDKRTLILQRTSGGIQ